MGAITSANLVLELQRRLTNLDSATALKALNRACRWVARQASYEFMATTSKVLTVDTPTAPETLYTGVVSMVQGTSLGCYVSGSHFDTSGLWALWYSVGDRPAALLVPTGHAGLTITIGGTDYECAWAGTWLNGQCGAGSKETMEILASWNQVDGNYDWSLTTSTPGTSPGPVAMDPGKARTVLNQDGSPVQHVPWSEFWASYNYNVPSSVNYDTYTMTTDNTVSPPTTQFYFFPTHTGAVTLFYHNQFTDLTGGADYTQLPKDFDDLIVDLAEAEERRVYDIGDTWQVLFQRSQDQIKLLMDGYKSMTTQPAMLSESTSEIQEKSSLGRA